MNKIEISDTLLFKFFLGETTNDETDRIAAWLDAKNTWMRSMKSSSSVL